MSEFEPQFEPEDFQNQPEENFSEPERNVFEHERVPSLGEEPTPEDLNFKKENFEEQEAKAKIISTYGEGDWKKYEAVDDSIKTVYDAERHDTYIEKPNGEREYTADTAFNIEHHQSFLDALKSEGQFIENFVDEKTGIETAFVSRLNDKNEVDYFTYTRKLEERSETEYKDTTFTEEFIPTFNSESVHDNKPERTIEPSTDKPLEINLDSFFASSEQAHSRVAESQNEFNFQNYFTAGEVSGRVAATGTEKAPLSFEQDSSNHSPLFETGGIVLVHTDVEDTSPNLTQALEKTVLATVIPTSEALPNTYEKQPEQIAAISIVGLEKTSNPNHITESRITANQDVIQQSYTPEHERSQSTVEETTTISPSAAETRKDSVQSATQPDASERTSNLDGITDIYREVLSPEPMQAISLLPFQEQLSITPIIIESKTQEEAPQATTDQQASHDQELTQSISIAETTALPHEVQIQDIAAPWAPSSGETYTEVIETQIEQTEAVTNPTEAFTQNTNVENISVVTQSTSPTETNRTIQDSLVEQKSNAVSREGRLEGQPLEAPFTRAAQETSSQRTETVFTKETISLTKESSPLLQSIPSIIRSSLDNLRQQPEQNIQTKRVPIIETRTLETPQNPQSTEKTTLYTPLGQEQIVRPRGRVVSTQNKRVVQDTITAIESILSKLAETREQSPVRVRQEAPERLTRTGFTSPATERPRPSIEIPTKNTNSQGPRATTSSTISSRPTIQPISQRPQGFVPDEVSDDSNGNNVIDLINNLRQAA